MISKRGVTILEALIGMLLLVLVVSGVFAALVFSRRTTFRSESDLVAYNHIQRVLERLRLAAGNPVEAGAPDFLNPGPLAPGVYVDEKLGNAGPFAGQDPKFKPPVAGAIPLPDLDLPADFQTRYQTDPGTDNTWLQNDGVQEHGDGVVLIVEAADDGAGPSEDLDGDGRAGLDFNGDGATDLFRVRLYLKKTTPQPR